MKCIIDNKEINVENIEVVETNYRTTIFKTLKINNEFLLKSRDKIIYICSKCGKEITEKFSMNEKFLEENYICRECSFSKTKLEKYGSKNAISQIKSSIQRKYGVDNVFRLEEIKEKRKQTNLKRYGVEYNLQRKELRLDKRRFSFNNFENFPVIPLFSLDDYVLFREKYHKFSWKCKECNTIFDAAYANGTVPRCPNCFPYNTSSSTLEKEVADWLKQFNLNMKENDREIIHKELDVYIPEKSLAIEFDGLYWHSELRGKDSNYHLDKTDRCKNKNIKLLHIFEDEWIEKQDIVKSIIKSKLGLYDRAIGARKCILKEISNQEASDFYDMNHIQGKCKSPINIGLFYQNKLVSCLSFSKPRYNKHYQWEITRFANLLNTTVHGSFSKLWKYFLNTYKPESLITYSDKRYFDGSIYRKYFAELQDSGPAYWYVKDGIRHNRVEFQKHKLNKKLENFDSDLTEWENMQLNGWDRIWDCGNKIFEWRKV